MREIVSFTYEPANGGNVCRITVTEDGDGFAVRWSDLVANEWVERFETLATALARVSALVHCGANGWQRGFTTDAYAFQVAAESFFGEVTA